MAKKRALTGPLELRIVGSMKKIFDYSNIKRYLQTPINCPVG